MKITINFFNKYEMTERSYTKCWVRLLQMTKQGEPTRVDQEITAHIDLDGTRQVLNWDSQIPIPTSTYSI